MGSGVQNAPNYRHSALGKTRSAPSSPLSVLEPGVMAAASAAACPLCTRRASVAHVRRCAQQQFLFACL